LGVNPIGFNEWVKLTYGEKVPRYYDKPKMFMPQVVWISDRTGTILVNYVGRFENLDADFKEVCSRLGTRARLPHLKKSAKGPYQTLYTPECIEIVAKWFAHDIETFGYTFK
jgi:hypothetical protein